MIYYNDFYKIIDEVRAQKNISVDDLCENIISTRTYYRYLNGEVTIKFITFSRLIDRLHVSLSELSNFSMYFAKPDPGIMKFMVRMAFNTYKDIIPIYETLNEFISEIPDENLFISSMITKYKYDIKEIDLTEAIKQIENNVKSFQSNESIFYLFSSTLLYSISKDNKLLNINSLIDKLITFDYRLTPLHTIIAIDLFLNAYIDDVDINNELFTSLFKRFKDISRFFVIKQIKMDVSLFEAYIYFLNNDNDNKNTYLSKYFASLLFSYHGDFFYLKKEKIEKLFKVDMNKILNDELSKRNR